VAAADSGPTAAGSTLALPPKLVRVSGFIASLILTFIGLTAITFTIGRVMPADPVLAIVGDRASQEVYDQMFLQLGLDQPIYVQYF
jgi:peptide/nickel transport system permease protein